MQVHQTSEKRSNTGRKVQDHTFVVTGRWPFPTDMLRRDSARPATRRDERLITEMSAEHAPDYDFLREKVMITLIIPNAGTRLRPLVARWESFGWSVVGSQPNVPESYERRMARLYDQAMAKLTDEEIEAVAWHHPSFQG